MIIAKILIVIHIVVSCLMLIINRCNKGFDKEIAKNIGLSDKHVELILFLGAITPIISEYNFVKIMKAYMHWILVFFLCSTILKFSIVKHCAVGWTTQSIKGMPVILTIHLIFIHWSFLLRLDKKTNESKIINNNETNKSVEKTG